jgi:rubrerythrin
MIIDRFQHEAAAIASTTPKAIREAMAVVYEHETPLEEAQHWVCEVCGMPHSGESPAACDSCGRADALTLQPVEHRELFNRW